MSATEIPGYKIIRTLGVGGQATVYLAIQKGFDREVALKVMSPALAADPTFGERFIREAKIVAKLSHKSIVTVYDVGESGNFYYLAMEYLPKGDLKSRIEEGIKTRDCLTIIGKLAKALHFAHEKGYIHRDVKSENILFNDDGEPLLTDFGIAKASNSSTQMTQTGKLIGTPEYMSPEQCRGKTVDGRSDLYSLGVILYEMLTRNVPFTGEDSVAVCIKHVTKPVPKLPQRLSHFQWLINSLMAKDASKRFQNGGELAAAILKFGKTGKAQKVKPSPDAPTETVKRTSDTDEFSAIPEGDDHFEELHTEKRYQISDMEEESSIGKIVALILLIVVGAGGFLTREQWYPQAAQWVNQLTGPSTEQSGQASTGQPNTNSAQNETVAENKAPTAAELLQEADALVQFVPQKVEDIKQALKLVATVNTLEPGNKNAQLIYQNILSSSLMEATEQAEKNNFIKAEEWLSLVAYEQPDYALLEATRTKISDLKTAFESQNTQRKQKGQQLEQLIASGQEALKANRLSSPVNDNAIQYFEDALKIDPDNALAKQGLQDVSVAYEALIEKAIEEKRFSRAKTFLSRFNSLSEDQAKKLALRQKISKEEKSYSIAQENRRKQAAVAEQARLAEAARREKLNDPMIQMRLLGNLDSAKSLESQGVLVMPEGNNAVDKYRAVLAIDDRNQEALQGIARIEKTIIDNLTDAIANNDKSTANQWLTQLKLFQDDHPEFESYRVAVSEILELMPVAEQPIQNDLTNDVNSKGANSAGANSGSATADEQQTSNSSPEANASTSEANDTPINDNAAPVETNAATLAENIQQNIPENSEEQPLTNSTESQAQNENAQPPAETSQEAVDNQVEQVSNADTNESTDKPNPVGSTPVEANSSGQESKQEKDPDPIENLF